MPPDLRGSLALSVEAVERLARTLYRAMAQIYRETLLRLGRHYGQAQRVVVLSAEIRQALAAQAADIARAAIATFNRLSRGYLDRNRDRPPAEVVAGVEAYMRERAGRRAKLIAGSAVNPARLDAIVGFYLENGVVPQFDFRGRGEPPSCLTCVELVRTSPHPVELVRAVGYPHPNCTHSWHVKGITRAQLQAGGLTPGKVTLGRGDPAGLLGVKPLLLRVRDQEQAVAEIRRIRAALR